MKISKKQENKIFDLLFNVISIKHRNKNEYLNFLDGVVNTILIFNNYKPSEFLKRLDLMKHEYK